MAFGRQRDKLHAMTRVGDLAKLALELDEADRLELAAQLLRSVEGDSDPQWTEAWREELARRRTEGSTSAQPWNAVRDRILARVARR